MALIPALGRQKQAGICEFNGGNGDEAGQVGHKEQVIKQHPLWSLRQLPDLSSYSDFPLLMDCDVEV